MQKSISKENKKEKMNNSYLDTSKEEHRIYKEKHRSWSSLISRYITGIGNMNKSKFVYHMIPLVAMFFSIPIFSTNLIIITPGISMLYIMYISDQPGLNLFESVNISLASGFLYLLSLITFVTTQAIPSLILTLVITLIYIVYCLVYSTIIHKYS